VGVSRGRGSPWGCRVGAIVTSTPGSAPVVACPISWRMRPPTNREEANNALRPQTSRIKRHALVACQRVRIVECNEH
jgi:hypothetical protein